MFGAFAAENQVYPTEPDLSAVGQEVILCKHTQQADLGIVVAYLAWI